MTKNGMTASRKDLSNGSCTSIHHACNGIHNSMGDLQGNDVLGKFETCNIIISPAISL